MVLPFIFLHLGEAALSGLLRRAAETVGARSRCAGGRRGFGVRFSERGFGFRPSAGAACTSSFPLNCTVESESAVLRSVSSLRPPSRSLPSRETVDDGGESGGAYLEVASARARVRSGFGVVLKRLECRLV